MLLLFFLLCAYCWMRSLEGSPYRDWWACTSYLFLGLGISFKIMPALWAPFLLLADVRATQGAWRMTNRVLLLVLGAAGPFLIQMRTAGWSVLYLFQYHSERPIHMESVWGSAMLVARAFGVPCEVSHSYGGYNLVGQWEPAWKAVAIVSAAAAGLALGLWALRRGQRFDRGTALDCAYLALVNSTVLSTVYSPQYLNWLLPISLLLAMSVLPKRWEAWCAFAALAIVIVGFTSWLYPWHYSGETGLVALACAAGGDVRNPQCLPRGAGSRTEHLFSSPGMGLHRTRAGESQPRDPPHRRSWTHDRWFASLSTAQSSVERLESPVVESLKSVHFHATGVLWTTRSIKESPRVLARAESPLAQGPLAAVDDGSFAHLSSQLPADLGSTPRIDGRAQAHWIWAVCGFLLLAVGLVFGQTVRHEFIGYDDHEFVYENPYVTPGLTLSGLRWAFTDGTFHEWTPLSSLSHMLDCQLYGLNPAGHYLTNVLLHAASSVLLFLALLRMTDQRAVPEVAQASGGRAAPAGPSATTLWPCAWVAAVFAIHPLHVESVAWVAERRDVLSGLFFMLTLLAYARYAERPSWSRYLAVFGCLALGLMSKPMLVTVPFVLLLLDYWPLDRFRTPAGPGAEVASGSWFGRLPAHWRLVVEKVPLLALAAASCGITVLTHSSLRSTNTVDPLSMAMRLANALVSYAAYLGQSFFPVNMVPYYPHLGADLPIAWAAGSLALLLAISAVATYCWRRRPYLLVGWLWFLGMLVPVLGLVGVFVYCPGRPLYVSESDWIVDRPGLGRVERLSVTTIDRPGRLAAMDARGGIGRDGARAGRRRLASDFLLAQRRGTLDACGHLAPAIIESLTRTSRMSSSNRKEPRKRSPISAKL